MLTGCGDQGSADAMASKAPDNGASSNPDAQKNAGQTPSAERAVAEADIIQLRGDRLYAMSKSGTLSIVDLSTPGTLRMLGQAYLPGEPFEMYVDGTQVIAMMNGAYSVSGATNDAPPPVDLRDGSEPPPSAGGASAAKSSAPVVDRASGAGIMVVDAGDPARMSRVATFAVSGEIADSRMVGSVLYLATYENGSCYRCTYGQRTLVTSFDLSSRSNLRQVDQVAFSAWSATGWSTDGWKRSITLGDGRLYVGGHGDLVRTSYNPQSTEEEGEIDVVDVSDPTGKLVRGAHITTPGAIMSRWQMDERDGMLRVVSQPGVGYSRNGVGNPQVQTFHVWNSGAIQKVGQTGIRMPRQEALKTVRFDKDRAYAITFAETDPLFIIDLANPAAPRQRGELTMPGWVFHLEPAGNRLLGLGLDRRSTSGHLNVSLFDVADMDHPKMLSRVSFGPTGYASDQQITGFELPEDQDRIQKAFRVLDNGLIVAPYSGVAAAANSAGAMNTACPYGNGGVQLIDWRADSLQKQATLPVSGNPRRALLNPNRGQELIAVSDSNVTAFDVARRDSAFQTADLVIGSCEPRTANNGATQPRWGGNGTAGDFQDGYDGHGFLCAASPARRSNSSSSSMIGGIVLGLAALGAVSRRRRRAA